MMQTTWTINEIAKRTKLSKDTIRYYEKEQLISPERKKNNYRLYTESDLMKLKYISVMKYARFSLKEIKEFMLLSDQKLSKECNQEGQNLLKKKRMDLEITILHYQSILMLLEQIPYPENFELLSAQLTTNDPVSTLDQFIEHLFEEIKEGPYENY